VPPYGGEVLKLRSSTGVMESLPKRDGVSVSISLLRSPGRS